MSSIHYKYVLVGAGPAAGAAAFAIRKLDAEGTLVMVGLEVNRPYRRHALGRELLSRADRGGDFFTLDERWFTSNHVDLRTGQRIAQLDLTHRAVLLESGMSIGFDKMLLATGAAPKHLDIPGSRLPGVYYLRRIEDADRMHHAVDHAKAEGRRHETGRGRAVIIGSGLLAIDLAATLKGMNLAVDLVYATPHLLPGHTGATAARYLQAHLERHGIHVHAGVSATRIEGDGRAQRVGLADGTVLDCDLVTPALGIVPNKELTRGTSIKAEKHVLVDEFCRTSIPDVFAAGDVVAVLDPLLGKYRRLEHWESAMESGAVAGHNMAGTLEPYTGVDHFELNLFGTKLEVWGDGRHIERRLVRGTTPVDTPDFVEFGLTADGRVALAIAVNHAGERARVEEMVRQRQSVAGREAEVQDLGVGL